jgi:two-component system, NtrC family, sensor histidine kinase KinB
MKRRIFIGLAPLFLLLLAMGAYAVSLFAKLGSSVDVILRENYRSVLAGQQMKETAERMDSALFFSLVGEEERGRKMYDQNLPLFRESLDLELHNITLPGEQELANNAKNLHERYAGRAQEFWGMKDIAARRSTYFGEMLPTFTEIKDTAQEIIRINQENMVAADHAARNLSARSTRYMAFAALAGMVGAIFFAARLQRSILQPIQTLTSVSKELGDGKLDQVVPVIGQDELGQLADAFNKMAAKLRAYRRVTSDQLLQARQMTEITFSAFPDAIIALSREGQANFMNPAADRLLRKLNLEGSPATAGSLPGPLEGNAATEGSSPDPLPAPSLPSPLLQHALPPAAQKEAERVLKGGPDYLPSSFENAICVRVSNHETFLLPRVIGMRDESGSLFGAAVVLQDVTRFRLLDDVKSNLVSTVSHELKTPLTSVRMGLHLLLEERIGALNPKQTELLIAARDDSERLLRMINDLLDLAKLESGRSTFRDTIGAGALIAKAGNEMRDFVEARGMRLVTKTSPDLPEVSVDTGQIAHVFSNFLSNAVKHTRHGEEIVLQAMPQGDGVRFSVLDSGPGIPVEHQARLFDRFFRVPGTEVSGAGLGLAIAREIVEAQGGVIGVRSEPGNGSEFYFDLPAAEAGGADRRNA